MCVVVVAAGTRPLSPYPPVHAHTRVALGLELLRLLLPTIKMLLEDLGDFHHTRVKGGGLGWLRVRVLRVRAGVKRG